MTETPKLFGFAQFEFPGTLSAADGRYVVRDGEKESVLVVETRGAPPPPSRRRRRPRAAEPDAEPRPLPLTRVTAVRAFEELADEREAKSWLAEACGDEEKADAVVEEGIALFNRALHAYGTAGANPYSYELTSERASAVRVGYGSGEELAGGHFSEAREIDVRGGSGSRRRQRAEELRPQGRVAAVLGGREHIDTCETLLLRVRADLDAGRMREAALQLRVALEALLIELRGALTDPGHEEDMTTLGSRRSEVGEAANMALHGDLDAEHERSVREIAETCERVLRRRRVLRG